MHVDESFMWHVDSDGYSWIWEDSHGANPNNAVDQMHGWKLRPNGGKLRSYAPLRDEPALFLRASEVGHQCGTGIEAPTPSTMQALKAFADEFGLFGSPKRHDSHYGKF